MVDESSLGFDPIRHLEKELEKMVDEPLWMSQWLLGYAPESTWIWKIDEKPPEI